MTINYTTLLGLAQPVTGTESNVWGDVVNDSITALLDSAIAGAATVSVTAGNVTLTDVNGSADQSRMAILILTGTPGTTRNVVAPSQSKTYIVINQSDASAVIKGSATTGATVRAGQAATCVWNGADFEIVASGDVDGPASATDNAIARYDGTTGKLIQNSAVTIADDGATVIAANSASDGLRITQIGAGNALVVEDSANPDATPVVIDSFGRVVIGNTAALTMAGTTPTLQLQTAGGSIQQALASWGTNTAHRGDLQFMRSASGVVGTQGVVANNYDLGALNFYGDDGTAFIQAAQILAEVDGTPGTNDMPGRLTFSTTADGASSPTERMRIDSTGAVGIGTTSLGSAYGIRISKTLTGATSGQGILNTLTANSTLTNLFGYNTSLNSAANGGTPYTLSTFAHYNAGQGTINADSTVTAQYGYQAASSLTGATNNYGFYSNIASGTGRYNFYANGTAENFFGGNTVVAVTDNTNAALRITQLGTGNALVVEDSANPDATPFVIDANGTVIKGNNSAVLYASGVTPQIQLNIAGAATMGISRWSANTSNNALVFLKSRGATIGDFTSVASGDNLGALNFYGTDGIEGILAAQILASVDGTPGTNDMPGRLVFSTTADGASTPTERMRIDSAGNVGIGGAAIAGSAVYLPKSATGAANTSGFRANQSIQSDSTTSYSGFVSIPSTAAASYTLASLFHFQATQSTFGAGSTVTNQYGFIAQATLTGATNNYGFFGNIASGTGRYNFYAAGTADNYFAGDMQLDKTVTAGGTTGAQTINKNAGTVNFAAAATSLVVTNSRVTTSSIIVCTVGTNDTTLKSVAAVAGAGSFTLHASAAATAETRVNFLIIN